MSQEIISKVLDALRTKISDFNYKNWFQNLTWEMLEPGKIQVRVPTRFIRDWLMDHYLELIKFEFFRLTEKEHEVIFKLDRKISKTLDLFSDEGSDSTVVTSQPAQISQAVPPATVQAVVAKPSANQSVPALVQPQAQQQAQRAQIQVQNGVHGKLVQNLGFNTKYRFENYVVGNANQLVYAASKAVASQPARSYNPLFIYGGVGLGKTHLLNAIGLEVLRQYPSWRIVYVTGEKFTNEVISAIRYGKAYEMRKKYRDNCDMLLIDDIQFIGGKERTMEEFFHTFNALYESRKQIILTSDQLPKNIPNIEERLKSRFGWGLMADIQSPDFETRIAILRKKAEDDGIVVPDDVCEFIATHVTDNVRDLEGSLVRVSAFASLAKTQINIDLTREVLRNILADVKPKLSVEAIQSRVAEFYNLKISDLKSKRRHKTLAVPRQIAMYLCKTHLNVSFPELGQKFGGKDHTTVMHAVRKITGCLDNDAAIKTDIGDLEKFMGV